MITKNFVETPITKTTTKRLIVLMNDCQANDQALAHAIYWLASPEKLSILYLVFVEDREHRMAVSRDMTTMKAVTAANLLQVEVSLVEKGDWLNTLQNIVCPGDVVICQEELVISNGGLKPITASEYLSNHMMIPIQIISGFYHPAQECTKKRIPEFFSLLGYLVILAVFTWLQVRLDLLTDGWVQNVFIMATFCIEMGAVWTWYKFTY